MDIRLTTTAPAASVELKQTEAAKSSSGPCRISGLPVSVLCVCLQWLSPREHLRSATVSRAFADAARRPLSWAEELTLSAFKLPGCMLPDVQTREASARFAALLSAAGRTRRLALGDSDADHGHAFLTTLLQRARCLTSLHVSCWPPGGQHLEQMEPLDHVRELSIFEIWATKLELHLFPHLESLTLRVLDVAERDVYALVARIPSLTALDVACPVNQVQLLACVQRLPGLRDLALTVGHSVHWAPLRAFRDSLADLAPWVTRITIAGLDLSAESPRARSDGLRLDVLAPCARLRELHFCSETISGFAEQAFVTLAAEAKQLRVVSLLSPRTESHLCADCVPGLFALLAAFEQRSEVRIRVSERVVSQLPRLDENLRRLLSRKPGHGSPLLEFSERDRDFGDVLPESVRV